MPHEKLKKAASIAGKTLATIVCPPLGGALFGRDGNERITGGLIGFACSVVLSLSTGIVTIVNSQKIIYDNPKIHSTKYVDSFPKTLLFAFVSPIAHYKQLSPRTVLKESQNDKSAVEYSVKSRDIIKFDNNQYRLMLDYGNEFRTSPDKNWQSVQQAQNEFNRYHEQGNILKAREAKAELEEVTKNYNELKNKFQQAVDKMNSELEQLAKEGTSK